MVGFKVILVAFTRGCKRGSDVAEILRNMQNVTPLTRSRAATFAQMLRNKFFVAQMLRNKFFVAQMLRNKSRLFLHKNLGHLSAKHLRAEPFESQATISK